MGFKGIGYFVNGFAKCGFVGGIGGKHETTEKDELYNRIVALLKREDSSAIPAAVKVTKEEGLEEKWKTASLAKNKISRRWSNHKSWWTLKEIEEELARVEEEDIVMSEIENEKQKSAGTPGSTDQVDTGGPVTGKHQVDVGCPSIEKTVAVSGSSCLVISDKVEDISMPMGLVQNTNSDTIDTDSEMDLLADEQCAGCEMVTSRHQKKEWYGCSNCGRFFIGECAIMPGTPGTAAYWKCEQCLNVNMKIEKLMDSDPNGKLQSIEGNMQEIVKFITGLRKPSSNDNDKQLVEQVKSLQKENQKLESVIEGKNKGLEGKDREIARLIEVVKQKETDVINVTRQLRELQEVKEKAKTKVVPANDSEYSRKILIQNRKIGKLEEEVKTLTVKLEKEAIGRQEGILDTNNNREKSSSCQHKSVNSSLFAETNSRPERSGNSVKDYHEDKVSEKRKFESTAKERAKKLKTKPEWILVTDSLLKPLVQEKGLNVTAMRNNWEVRVKRGAKLKDIAELLRSNEDRMYGADLLVVCGGSNDMSNISKGQDKEIQDEQYKQFEKDFEHVIECCRGHAREIIFMLPPPRRDVPANIRYKVLEIIHKCCEGHLRLKPGTITIMKDEETESEFMRKIKSDKIHPGVNEVIFLIKKLAERMDTKVVIENSDQDFDKQDVFPRECWMCGGKVHNKSEPHEYRIVGCDKCGLTNHNEDVCLSKVRMCTLCGRRGHSKFRCTYSEWSPQNMG